ncbi:MAG: carboxypeptidase M32, partial [Solobacterium sp.]|nr:carboxypeptidase M32 [Solobacterium sp.]
LALKEGRYTDCISWLKEHIQKYGAIYSASEIMEMATGEPFSPQYFLDYLEAKYSALYQFD